MSTGAFTLADIDKPKGKFSASDIGQPQADTQFTYPAAGPGAALFTTKVSPQEAQRLTEENRQARIDAGKQALVAGGAMIAPELLPEMTGGGVLGFLGRMFAKAGMSGLGAAAGNTAGQALTGGKPTSAESLEESAKLGLFTAAIATPLQFLGELATSKLGRGMINQSVGAQTRDITYGNPAKFLTDNGIHDISTGDYEAYKTALRSGQPPEQAAAAAGGRFSAVAQRVNEYGQRLDRLLQGLPSSIPVQNVIAKPLDDAMVGIINDPALTDPEKLEAFNHLFDLRKSLLSQFSGPTATPVEMQVVKQAIGNRVNWTGNENVANDIRGAYRSVYGSAKNAINAAAPGSAADINEQLTNGLAAFKDLDILSRAEEVGRGSGVARGKTGLDLIGMLSGEAGRVLPAASNAPGLVPAGATIGQQLQSKGIPQPQVGTPTLPFNPGAGIPKPRVQQ